MRGSLCFCVAPQLVPEGEKQGQSPPGKLGRRSPGYEDSSRAEWALGRLDSVGESAELDSELKQKNRQVEVARGRPPSGILSGSAVAPEPSTMPSTQNRCLIQDVVNIVVLSDILPLLPQLHIK